MTKPEAKKPGNKLRKLLYWAVGLFLFYVVAGFLILPPIIRSVAVKNLSQQLNREVSIEKVKLNPFALSVTVTNLLIKDRDGEPLVSWAEVYVNLQARSFFGHPWVFKEISTTRPFVRMQVNKDYSLNFSDLIAKFSTNAPASPPPPKPARPLALEIERLHIGGATAALVDLTPRTPFKRVVGPLEITLTNFRTDPENQNPYSFTGTTDAGEKISWGGVFYLDPLRSQGDFALEHFSLNKYAPLYQDFLRVEIKDGVIDLRTSYHFELSPTHHVATVTNTALTLRDFKVAEPGSAANIGELTEFSINGVSVDATARTATVNSITATDGKIMLRRDQNAAINVVELSKPVADATNAPGGILFLLQSVTNVVAQLLNSTNAWSGTIREVNVTNCSVSLEDLVNSRPVQLNVDQIELVAKNISNLPGTNLTASLALRWNTNGTVKVGTTASFLPPTVDVDLALDGLELRALDPYLESKLNLFVLDSKLGMNGHVRLRTKTGELPEVTFTGDTWLNDFSTVDGAVGDDLLNWKSVRLSGLAANLNPPTVAINEIAVNDAFARLIVETNRTINLLTALRMTDTNAPTPEPAPPEKNSKAKKPPVVVAAAPAPDTNASSSLPKISVASVVISNTQARFTDRSISPEVNLVINEINGTVKGISSEALQHADVDLRAKVDGVGPVEISGLINPLNGIQTNEIKIVLHDMDLTPTSPYAGKFAGYRIAKGKLNLALAYHLQGRALKSENIITLDQFTFGEKVASPEATHLPVRLAVAILKDREGKIVLDVPMEGSLDDPQFKIHKVVMRALENILVKVATSPFSLLGAVFGGKSEEINFQEFEPGSVELLPAAKEKLDALVKALDARPALQMEIAGSVDAAKDREALRHAALEKRLRTAKWMSLRKSAQTATPADQLVLAPEERAKWLKVVYATELGKNAAQPVPVLVTNATTEIPAQENKLAAATVRTTKSPTPPAGKGAAQLMHVSGMVAPIAAPATNATNTPNADASGPATATTTPEAMEQALVANISIGDSELEGLAAERAKAVREYFVQMGKVEEARLFLRESGAGGLKQDGSRVYLQLQ